MKSAVALAALGALLITRDSVALPPGRAWSPSEHLQPADYWYIAAPRLERDAVGVPKLYGTALNPMGSPRGALGYRWSDTTWANTWRIDEETYALWPVQSGAGTSYVVWVGVNGLDDPYGYVRMAELRADTIAWMDSVTRGPYYDFEYSGAVSAKRRWVALQEQSFVAGDSVRVLYSDTLASWTTVPMGHVYWHGEGIALGVIDDTTAILVWAGARDRWGLIRGDQWERSPTLLPELAANRPRLRRRPSGGQWLAWGTSDADVRIASYREGAWSSAESLRCAYRDLQSPHWSDTPDLSRDDDEYEYPVVAWSSASGSYTVDANVCVCIPSDSGYAVAEEVDQAVNGLLPGVIRDRNGDVWLAWWMSNYWGGVYWCHTYTTAVADTPRVVGAGRLRQVRWRLSEPAPGTWWAVERARGDEAFESVARVRAAPGLEQAWTDTSPPAGLVRYRIRRESVDKRYEWLSAEGRWPAKAVGPRILRLSANPVGERLAFEITDAIAGPLEVRLYDLQGRVVWRAAATSAGTGRDAFNVDLPGTGTRLHPGVYFLRARDAAGRESATAKIALVR